MRAIVCAVIVLATCFLGSGTARAKALTCRAVTVRGEAPSFASVASCAADEFLMSGGGRCEVPGSDLCSGVTKGRMHANHPTADLKGWVVDCYAVGGDTCSEATAICCKLK